MNLIPLLPSGPGGVHRTLLRGYQWSHQLQIILTFFYFTTPNATNDSFSRQSELDLDIIVIFNAARKQQGCDKTLILFIIRFVMLITSKKTIKLYAFKNYLYKELR